MVAQNDFQVNYGVAFIDFAIDTSNIENSDVKKHILKSEREAQRALKPDLNLVTLNYDSKKNLVQVSLIEIMDADEQTSISRALPGISNFKHNLNEGMMYYKDGSTEKQFDLSDVDWKIIDDYKSILGYECQKARTTFTAPNGKTSEIVAWFTTEIPVSSGPYKYAGLPGLILEITNYGREDVCQRG